MAKANEAIRKLARDKRIPLWRIADNMGISEITLIRRLRHELPEEDSFLIKSIIIELASAPAGPAK